MQVGFTQMIIYIIFALFYNNGKKNKYREPVFIIISFSVYFKNPKNNWDYQSLF